MPLAITHGQTADAVSVVQADVSAHHYKFLGIEFAMAAGKWAYVIVALGSGTETDLAQLPHDIIIDQCYVHGDPTAQPGTKRGIALNAANVSVLNSYIAEIHVVGQDNQAIAGFNEALRRKPNYVLAYRGRGDAFYRQGAYDQAIAGLASTDPKVRLHSATLLKESAYVESAIPLAKLLSDPDNAVQLEAIAAEMNIFTAGKAGPRRVGIITNDKTLAAATGLPFDQPGPAVLHGGLRIHLYRTPPL